MKRSILVVALAAAALAAPGTFVHAAGNGGPSGAHFTLNIIGASKEKASTTTSNGRVIFVPLAGTAKILLTQGDFRVLDANGTDGTASFRLPNPDPDSNGITAYSVYARALGKPGGKSTTTTCFTDASTGERFCSAFSMVLVRGGSKSTFTNVSKQLLYAYADIDADGDLERIPLFSDLGRDYFWQYSNDGLKLAQLRFYEIPTTVD